MGKDVKRKFTVSLDIDTKDAEKQIKSTVGNIKNILENMGNASDKMGYFKDLVNYIQQIDSALTAFKQKNAGAFSNMFDGLDTNLKEVLASIFNTSGKSTTVLDTLRDKINNAAANGAGVKELRSMAKEINALFVELGHAAPIDIEKNFSGHGNLKDRIDILKNSLDSFATVWSGVNKKISEGFSFGGTGSGAGIDGIVGDLGDKTNKAVNELESAKKLVEKAVKDFYDALITDADDTAKLDSIKRSLQKALSFDDVKFEDIADTFADLEFGDIEEDEAIKKITDVVTKIQNAKQELNNTLQNKDTKSSGVTKNVAQSVTADSLKENANETVDAIAYAKKVIVSAYKDYFNAVEKAKNSGFNLEYGDSSPEMDDIKYSINDMLDNWGVKKSVKGQYSPKMDLDLSEFISDGDIGFDDIEKEIDKIFQQNGISFNASIDEMIADTAKLQSNTSSLAGTTQKSSQEISSDLTNIENKTQNVTSAFQELISYISQSGTSPKAFFDSLESGAEEANGDLKNILTTLNLIGSDGGINFTSIKNGFTHQGGMVSDNYTLIARDEKYAKYAFESQPKLLAAKSMGANVGAIVDVYKDEVNGLVYELQNTVKGKGILDFKNSIVNTEFLDATDEQIKKLIQDLLILQKTGLYVDWGGDNILYDKNEGFSFIDLASKATHFTASEENSVHENINKFFETALNLDPMSLNTSFMKNISKLTDEVINEANGIQKINEQQDEIQSNSAASAVVIKNEESAHEQNAQAINEENKALQAQIELKKQAQSMTWEKFALDESSIDLKNTAGLQTLSDVEKFWKNANYEKKIDFHELSESDTKDIIDSNLDYNLRKKWYVDQDFSVKPQIENAILTNDALRNAAMNKLYQIYKKYIDSAIEFDEFLNSEIAVCRGDSGLPAVYGEEQLLSFSFKESTANSFGNTWNSDASIISANIVPKETIGSVSDSLWYDSEAEVFVPVAKTPNNNDTSLSFEEYYNGLSAEMQKEVDGRLINLEKQRIANLLGDDLAYKTKLATKNGHLRDVALNDFSQGSIPNQIDESQYYGFDNHDFGSIYNSLSEMQKKLVAYYSALQLENKYIKNFSSEDIGNTGILNAIMNDKTGVKQHVASLTGEARFKLFGDATQDISSEIAAHKANTQAIQDETKAQQGLNNSKIAFDEVNYKLGNAVLSSDGDKMSELNSIWNGIDNVGKTVAEDFSHVINDGYYVSGSTGELLNVADLMDAVVEFEAKYGENLQFVKDYLDQVYQKYNADINAFLSGKDVSFASDNPDFEDELILDDFDLYKENYTAQDYANAYAKESGEAQKAINDYAVFKQEYDDLMSTINRAPIDIMFPGVPTDNEKAAVLAIFEAIKEKQNEIANMPLLETEDDIKKVQTLQAEVVGLQNQLRGAKIPGASSVDYKEAYGLSSYSDGFELKKIIDGFSLYPVADELYGQLLTKNNDMIDAASADFVNMTLFGDQDSYNEFLSQHAKNIQAQQVASQQQLQTEQAITAEKTKQASIDDAESLDNSTIQDIQAESTALDNLIVKLNEVKTAIDNKTMAFKEEGAIVDQVVQQELLSLAKLAVAIDEIQAALNTINQASISGDIDTQKLIEDSTQEASVEIQTSGDLEAPNNSYALDSTLLTTNSILENILATLKSDESKSSLTGSLSDAVAELKNVASGIVEHQKAQQTDKTAASTRIANNYGQLSSISSNAVSSLGDEVQVKQMKALADGVVRVEGAVRGADGVWKGFIVDINESNNAVVHAVNEQSAFAKTLNESAEAAKKVGDKTKEASKQDEFSKSLSAQQASFKIYRESLNDVSYLNDEVREKFDNLAVKLNTVNDASGLEKWKDDFEQLKDEIDTVQTVFDREESKKIKDFRGSINSEFKKLDFTTATSNPTKEQQEILNLRSKLLLQLEENNKRIEEGKYVELDAINATMDALRQKINVYREENDLISGSKQKFGATAALNATAKYNSLQKMVSNPDGGFLNSSAIQPIFQQYEAAYNGLIAKRRELASVEGILTDSQKAEFKQLQTECNNFAKAIENIIKSSQKLEANGVERWSLSDDFKDDVEGCKNALRDFVKETYNVDVATDSFKNNFNECTFAIENGDGTFTQMTATINAARTAIVATAGDTKKATTAFGRFFDELKSKFKSISAYLISSFSIQEVWQQIRKGVNYVREIDTALTELKKVTNETDAAYNQFLQDMSKTAGGVGSTVKDLTTMSAEWARLGYSMEESGKLAKSTAILLNVSEFKDATTASEALISTMQAFQYTADESQHVVDILNEVGNNYAISSDGLATALQDSASALVEGGNNLEQASALIAAANKVVQDPNSVGTALRTISLRLRGTSVEILEEMGEETDGVVESTSKLQEKIKALSGVDILTNTGEYKDTYTILKEIGNVWKEMSDIDQAALLELMAGKNRANTLSAILSNMEDLEGAYESAMNAEGSAEQELNTYLDSIQGRIDRFNNSVQTLWMNTLDSEMVKGIVDFGTFLISVVDKLGLFQTALAGVLTYISMSSKNDFDLASALGIHDLKKGFSVFGKEGLTGWIAKKNTKIDKKLKGKGNIVNTILGDPSDVKISVQEFASLIQDNINDYVSIDTSKIDTEIDTIQNKLTTARKQLSSAKAADWKYYKSLGSMSPAKDRDNRIAEKTQEVANLEAQLTSLQAKRDSIVASAVNSVATSSVGTIQAETQAYHSMFDVLSQIQGVELDMGNEQDVATKIDGISNAAKNGQSALLDYVSTLGDGDAALKAYIASVEDGKYSLAGFQQFIQNHNKNVKKSGISAKAAAVGHQLLNAALSMGISLLASFAIDTVVKGIDKLITTTKEKAEAAEEALSKYTDSQSQLKKHKKTIDEISESYEELSKGVNLNTNENISLTTEAYEEYLDMCNQVADMYPQLVTGFDEQGNAILTLKGNVEKLTQAYNDAAQAARQEMLASGGDVFDTFENKMNYDRSGKGFWNNTEQGLFYQRNVAQEFLDAIVAEDMDVINKYLVDYVSNTTSANAFNDAMKAAGVDRSKWTKFVVFKGSVVNFDEVKKSAGMIASYIHAINNQIEAEANKIKPVINAYLGEDSDYAQLSDELQFVVNSVISDFDTEFLRQFDSMDDVYNHIKSNIIDPIQSATPEVKEALSNLVNIDPGSYDSMLSYYNDINKNIEIVASSDGEGGTFTKKGLKENLGYNDIFDGYQDQIYKIIPHLLEDEIASAGIFAIDDVLDHSNTILDSLTDDDIDLGRTVDSEGRVHYSRGVATISSPGGVSPVVEDIMSTPVKPLDDYSTNLNLSGNDGVMSTNWQDAFFAIEQLETKLLSLSPDEFTKSLDYIEKYGIKTWDELEYALQNKTFEFDLDLTAEAEGIEKLNTAINESVSATGLSAESIENIKTRYQELADQGYDVDAIFEETTNGIHLNTKALGELEQEYAKQQKTNLDKKLEGLVEHYNNLTDRINDCTDASERANLYKQRQNVLNQINDTATLASQYAGLTSAYKKWQDSQSAGNQRDMYEGILEGKKEMEDELSRGILDEGTRSYIELLSGKDLSTAAYDEVLAVYKELNNTIGSSGYNVWDFFTTNEDGETTSQGFFNFLDTVRSKFGDTAVWLDENGKYNFDFEAVGGDQVVAEALGISEELLQIILRAGKDFGFDIHLEDEYAYLAEFKTTAEEVGAKLKELGATEYVFNINSDSLDDVTKQVEEAQKAVEWFENEDGTLRVDVDENDYNEAKAFLAELTAKKQQLTDSSAAIMSVKVEATGEAGIEDTLAQLQNIKKLYNEYEIALALGADTTEIETKFNDAITKVKEEHPEMTVNLGVDLDTLQTPEEIVAAINKISQDAMISFGLDESAIVGYQVEEKTGKVVWENDDEQVIDYINNTKLKKTGYIEWKNTAFAANIPSFANGTAHAQGTAFAGGSWGAPKTETALVGELGPELV